MGTLVGTSGWQYKDWRGVLYPEGVPQRLWLETYAEEFPTVESNNAFYRLPTQENFAGWRDRTPDGFVMAVKASRYLTHIKRLADPQEPVRRLMEAAAGLKDKLGPILLQLPPTLKADPDKLARCLACFPDEVRLAVEPRHPSWWTDDVERVLRERAAALCWADRGGRPLSPLWRTAGWGYVRLHEGHATPFPEYGEAALKSWAERVREAGWREAYVYFNNDLGGAAVRNARRFARLL
ncbi:DUF72 domain-containing protein [Nonomuraea sp. NPDC050536]|uniref:DUF72 domain-containing protein n=1 Tax=Nonomuraea sp. NPDC050536 TaxID=3364366 RepID=UPI0037C6B68F